ncbi:MAG TPA: ATP-grasp domain-containing protein [Actinocrinis sp.]|uniref:ATP-grasp domain-containing protein n=1 Tax=Actinocrinis sp. TaxID=1920516 RepID=UPI002DDD7C6B|nr:ATP-grasp domain-containing protein [Actinocrinis sp.]HEV2345267.1 ATP-grasp domain-containing protein [Actinocrinis sp.]
MSRSSVLLVGADPYVLRACERHDVEAVLLCNSGAYDSGRVRLPAGSTMIRVDDVTNVEDLVAGLHRAGLGDKKFDAVQTSWEFSAVTVAALGRVLGCRTIDPETALYFRDKSLQKERLRAAGVPVTRTALVPDVYDVSEVPWEFEPAVLKPIAGGGTTSTSVVRSRKDLEDASRKFREERETKRTFLLEEFVDGDEWMAEGIAFGGEVLFFGLGIYSEPCLEAVTGQKPISLRRIDPDSEAESYQRAEPVVRAAIAALGLQDGVFHMELFNERETGRIVFSECAARRGGAMTQEQVLAKFNVDLGEAALLCALGRMPQIDVKVNPDVVGCIGFYGPAGTIVSYPTADEMVSRPDVVFAQMWVPPGFVLSPKFSASAEMIGAALLVSESVAAFDQRIEELRDWFGERFVVAEPGLTSGQRWAWQRKHWPDREYRDWLFEVQ